MANIRKTFNFRNGVQVDDDNLIVNPLGLVGVGTTVPTEALDVRGNLKVVGVLTVTESYSSYATIGVGTITTLRLPNGTSSIIGAGISIKSGIVTASSGIITYYGDGRYLQGLPTSQWIDVDSGLGYTSIYAQGNVGVATNYPLYTFQVGGDADQTRFIRGVGIDSSGNIYGTGIVTSYKFVGIGSDLTLLNASNISSGTISADRISSIYNSSLPTNISVSGIITASTNFSGTLIGNVIGIVTGNLVGIATTARELTSDAKVTITSVTSSLSRSGIATVDTRLDINGSVGVGTTGSGVKADIHVVRSGISSIQVTSFSGESSITVGRTLEQKGSSGSLKYGNTSGLYPYSSSNSLDIINYSAGSINSYLHLENPSGINTGSFNWIYGQDPTNPLLTLTYKGNLGIANTNPTEKLSVSGNASVTGNISGSNVSAATSVTTQNLYVTGTAVLPPLAQTNLNLISGISTFNSIKVNDTANVGLRLGVGTDNVVNAYSIQVGTGAGGNVVTIFNNGIAIGSTTPSTAGINASGRECFFGAVGLGTDTLRCAADFSDAGKGGGEAYSFMLLPRLTSTERTGLSPVEGAVIYSTTNKQFEGYNGVSWFGVNGTSGIATVSQGLTGTPNVSVGILTATTVKIGTGVTINSTAGIVTATNGFISGVGTAVQITTVGNRIYFTVAGVGVTSLQLF
jgi:hypothetical protein